MIIEIAKELGATPAQVLVAWGVHRGYSVIPKSVQAERIESNFTQVKLSPEVYEKITRLGDGNYTRCVRPPYGMAAALVADVQMQVQHPVPVLAAMGYQHLRRAGGEGGDGAGQDPVDGSAWVDPPRVLWCNKDECMSLVN